MNYLNRILILIGLVMLSGPSLAEERSAAAQLSAQLKPMTSLSARFEQTITGSDGHLLQSASGVLTVKRPRHFYWRTEQPYEHLVVTDGKVLWLYDIDLEQVSRQAFTADLDKAPALLLSGEVEAINRQYTVALKSDTDKLQQYQLLPINPEALFRELQITFQRGVLHHMQLRDSFDQLTHIQFSEVALNPVVEDALFVFTPPDGIDVITDEP